ncbi:hypothetical protein L210DRAFT_3609974 [Boletus edulis BED1]|uniref:Uncharacterized protein n=1 Tax=Boletus edulis BED1 TaxID=1328754 RepID=A0AAD4C3V9_BOLED|nr:hypothetical protein L210DRAFT_3609974 [Boletus edulis BED1]
MSRRPRKIALRASGDDTEKLIVHEITNVPAPIPDTGLPPPSADTTTLVTSPVSASQTPVTLKASPSRSHVPSRSTFVPLPSLKTQNLTEIEEAAAHSSLVIHPTPTVRPVATTMAGTDSRNPSPHLNTPHLSTTAIIALAVSGSLTLFIGVVLVILIKRPRRRRTPTPSLPMLHDGSFPDDKVESEGSPIFGGKERSSPTPQTRSAKGNTGLWTWTQYNSGIHKPAPTVTVTRSSSRDQLLTVGQSTQQGGPGQNRGQYSFIGYGNSNGISKSKSPIPLQPVQSAITRAVSRLSTVSMSLYPNSPGGYSQIGGDVGVAIDGVTRDEPGDIRVPRYKDRMMATRNRTSLIAPGSAKDAAAVRRSQSFAYGGMEPTSPPTASPNRVQLNGGRARIKSTYYTPGSYPRASAATPGYGKQEVEGGESRRGGDLATALELTSPIPPSPQPTLYPDDSMSVIGEAKKVTLTGRSQKKPVPKSSSHCDSPPFDTAALGSLMMVDFAASKSTASLVNIRPCEAARSREGQGEPGCVVKSNLKKRVEDRPPRVPSPPPMPSLAQMAMQHTDPEGYAEYHSPTYSIYGLYDGDRKSRASYGYS